MVKSFKGLPAFLQDRLSSKRMALVRAQYPKWLPIA